jgi:hypothetical protein
VRAFLRQKWKNCVIDERREISCIPQIESDSDTEDNEVILHAHIAQNDDGCPETRRNHNCDKKTKEKIRQNTTIINHLTSSIECLIAAVETPGILNILTNEILLRRRIIEHVWL